HTRQQRLQLERGTVMEYVAVSPDGTALVTFGGGFILEGRKIIPGQSLKVWKGASQEESEPGLAKDARSVLEDRLIDRARPQLPHALPQSLPSGNLPRPVKPPAPPPPDF